jgi:DNA polymerase I-like protein with 3'-5' exonuclease and polymerase domains
MAEKDGFVTTIMGRAGAYPDESDNFNEREAARRIAINTPSRGVPRTSSRWPW